VSTSVCLTACFFVDLARIVCDRENGNRDNTCALLIDKFFQAVFDVVFTGENVRIETGDR